METAGDDVCAKKVESFGQSGSEESQPLKSAGEPSCESWTVRRLDKTFGRIERTLLIFCLRIVGLF